MLIGNTSSDVRSPTSTRTEVRSPTRTSTEVRSPTRTSTWANTRGNFTSTVTGGAGAGATNVTISIPGKNDPGTLGNMDTDTAKLNYLRWLSRADPQMYALAMARAENKGELGDLSGWLDTIVGAAVTIGGTLLAKKQSDAALSLQKKQMQTDAAVAEAARADALRLALIQANTQRAAIGQPPVDISGQVIPQSQLPALTPQLAAQAQAYPSQGFSFASIPTWAYLAGAGVLALLLVRK